MMVGDNKEDGTQPRSFENSFWGKDDRGVETLMNKMRKAKQTCNELKTILNSRAQLEEEYGKKLLKISKCDIGKDESGHLQKSLSRLRSELEASGNAHIELSTKIKSDIESKLSIFINQQREKRKEQAAIIERSSKSKSLKHANLLKIKEKYLNEKTKANSMEAINSSAAKDIEKIQQRHQKIKQLETDYSQLSGELEEATKIWQHDWRVSCRVFQELEEQRNDFLKKVIWDYSNAVAEVCVKDDESSEKIRTNLQQLVASKEIQTFIDERATGFDPDYEVDGSPIYEIPSLDSPLEESSNSFSMAKPAQLFKKAFKVPHHFSASNSLFNINNNKSKSNSVDSPTSPTKTTTASKSTGNLNQYSSGRQNDSSDDLKSPSPPNGSNNNIKASSSLASFYDEVIEEEKNNKEIKNPSSSNLKAANISTNELNSSSTISNLNMQVVSPPLATPSAPPSYPVARPLFFVLVRVLYDYLREMEQELTIQQGQILAVLATHDDGWWEGEFVDPNTGVATRGIFPSNFTQRVD
ncbi:hypothetical protein K502DRAFT_340992 [Neoconidiobolus thromboides FSU 785]|nr:hypothetical protein K502DRAFT_340992 [Neoconidiobolus thromboides FSU 785]